MIGLGVVADLDLDEAGERVDLRHVPHAVRGAHRGVEGRRLRDLGLVGLVLEAEAAHQPSAGPGDLRGVEREILLLRHLDRDLREVGEEARAAERTPADAEPAEHLRLVADADLPQLYPRVEDGREVLHQLAEVHADLGGEIEQELRVVKGVFRPDELHREAVVLDLLPADLEGLVLERAVGLPAVGVLVGRDAEEGTEGGHDLRRGDEFVRRRREAVFDAARRLDDDGISRLHRVLSGREIVNLAAVAEPHAHDLDTFSGCVPLFGDEDFVVHDIDLLRLCACIHSVPPSGRHAFAASAVMTSDGVTFAAMSSSAWASFAMRSAQRRREIRFA